ncbi:MAG: hypothetical protein EP319_00010 [Deltaproteobacteria bacterium]|nr:MAG: hypothetical protein EP319_00010 [Deltaproteobacteria bacterium]
MNCRFLVIIFTTFLLISCNDTVKVTRLSSNGCSSSTGVLDTTFGTSGALEIDNPISYVNSNKTDLIRSITTDSAGNYLFTGTTWDDIFGGGGGTNFNVLIGKMNSSGTLDTSFGGGDGLIDKSGGGGTNADESGYDIKILSTGEIVVVGSYLNGGTTDFLISKWNTGGTVESQILIDGVGIASCDTGAPSSNDGANALAVDSSDNLYLTGFCLDDSGDKNLLVMKTNSSGALDTSFSPLGTAGVYNFAAGIGTNENGKDIVLTSSGSVIVAGTRENGTTSDTLLVKLTPTGVTDNTFGGGDGLIDAFVDGAIYKGQLNSIVLDSDENIYVAGRSHNGSNWDMTIWKYNSSGTLDTSWGNSGKLTYDQGGNEVANDIKIDSCGNKIVVFGSIDHITSGRNRTTIWRYNSSGTLDTSFGSGSGVVSNSLETTKNNSSNSGVITSSGQYVTGGEIREDTTDSACSFGSFCNLYITKWD